MHARSALFDLFGDYLRPRGGRAPVAAIVRLLTPLGVAPPAVRTAISRMVRQGWLHPLRLSTGPGYLLTAKAARRLDESAQRIYRTSLPNWTGTFDLIVTPEPADRGARARFAGAMGFLGYGRIDETTWVAPRPSTEVTGLLAEYGLHAERFTASHTDGVDGAIALVRRAWDLAEIGHAYARFVERMTPLMESVAGGPPDEQAYAARFTLVHEWRTFLFRDPQLPPELLPDPWPADDAAAFFDHHAARLRPAADRYVDECLAAYRGPRATARPATVAAGRARDATVITPVVTGSAIADSDH